MTELPQVLQLNIAGVPQAWINYEESAIQYAKGNVAWDMGAVEFDIHGGTNAKTGQKTVLTINTIIAIRGEMSKKAMKHYNRVPLKNVTLFRRDQYICAYCGGKFRRTTLTRDHIIPTSQGGRNIWTNVVSACEECNHRKANKTPEQAGMQLLYVPYMPNRAELLILENRRILTDQMKFLIAKVPKESRLLLS